MAILIAPDELDGDKAGAVLILRMTVLAPDDAGSTPPSTSLPPAFFTFG